MPVSLRVAVIGPADNRDLIRAQLRAGPYDVQIKEADSLSTLDLTAIDMVVSGDIYGALPAREIPTVFVGAHVGGLSGLGYAIAREFVRRGGGREHQLALLQAARDLLAAGHVDPVALAVGCAQDSAAAEGAALVVIDGEHYRYRHAAGSLLPSSHRVPSEAETVRRCFQSGLPTNSPDGTLLAAPVTGRHRVEAVVVVQSGSRLPATARSILSEVLREFRPALLPPGEVMESEVSPAGETGRQLHDSLTALPDRLLLRDRLQQAILSARRRSGGVSLLWLDLNRFKEVNDALGYRGGDLLLQQLAERLSGLLRQSDTVARVGVDQFAVLLPDGDATAAEVVAEKVVRLLESPFEIEGQQISVTGTLGVALFPDHGTESEVLLDRAEAAMTLAKRTQAEVAVYAPEQEDAGQRVVLMGELRQAIERGELVLYFQPKVHIPSGEVAGLEALARWKHPTRGLLPPAEFIPLAEHTGLIKALSATILAEAVRSQRLLADHGFNLPIAVNLSAHSLQDESLPHTIGALLQALSLAAGVLQVELTESAVMSDPKQATDVLTQLHDAGIHIAIDDFGTGYSSLAHLKRLPVDAIKIDKSFVRDMGHSDPDAFIARSVVELGHNLGIEVVAEGVEDQPTFDMLAQFHCDLAQGYLISRPLPFGQLLRWLEDGSDASTIQHIS